MATVSITFRMDAVRYVRMRELVRHARNGVQVTDNSTTRFIIDAVDAAIARATEAAKADDSGCDLGRSLFEVD